jgi:mono/diheme cytochrome c family protein
MSEEFKSGTAPADAEPTATRSTTPMWLIVLMLVLLFLGAVYFDHTSGWFDARLYGPYTSTAQLESYQPKSGAAAALAHGKVVFDAYCGLCHGSDGAGKPGQAPPLAGSEWVNTPGFSRLAHIPLGGLSGTIKVAGKDWSLNMAAMGAGLSDADLAAVLTYIRGSWGNKASAVSADDVNKIRAEMGKSPLPMTGDQMMKLPE